MRIGGLQQTSTLDFPGLVSAVVFTAGCNFRCPYCHNYQLVRAPESLLSLPADGVLARLRPFAGWIDGVVISGGEPTLHAGLAELCAAIKGLGFAVKLDTNGHRPQVVEALAARGLVDMVAMDLKAPLAGYETKRVDDNTVTVRLY